MELIIASIDLPLPTEHYHEAYDYIFSPAMGGANEASGLRYFSLHGPSFHTSIHFHHGLEGRHLLHLVAITLQLENQQLQRRHTGYCGCYCHEALSV